MKIEDEKYLSRKQYEALLINNSIPLNMLRQAPEHPTHSDNFNQREGFCQAYFSLI
jgi:hypothetical protein